MKSKKGLFVLAILIIIAIISIIISFLIWNRSKVIEPAGGYFQENIYTNDTLGMTITFPESWIIKVDDGVELQLNNDISEPLEVADKHKLMICNKSEYILYHENCLTYFIANKYSENIRDELNCSLEVHVEEYVNSIIQYKSEYTELIQAKLDYTFQTAIIKKQEIVDDIEFTSYTTRKPRDGKMVQYVTYLGFIDDYAIVITTLHYETEHNSKTELGQIIESINLSNRF